MKINRSTVYLFVVAAFSLIAVSCSESKGADTDTDGNGGGNGGVEVGGVRLADPFVLYFNGRYYAYGTSDTKPNEGFEVYYGDDMKQWWKYDNMLLSSSDSYGDHSFWAPEIYYREDNKTFYLYYSAEEHICVATSPSPISPFRQSEKAPQLVDKAIDSSMFVDDDGTAYLYFVQFDDGNCIHVAQLEDDWMTLKASTNKKILTAEQEWERRQGKIAEGPSVFKKDGIYYLVYSANHYESQDYAVGYATSSSPFGPFTKADENPILRRPDGLVGTGHGALFTDGNGDMKYVFHAHSNSTTINPREMYITDVSFSGSKLTMSSSNIIAAREVD